MATKTIWGSINDGGGVNTGSGDFSATLAETGIYVIHFAQKFSGVPAVVASQNNFGSLGEFNTDAVAVPLVSETSATLVTGDSHGNKQNRSFAFIAIGNV